MEANWEIFETPDDQDDGRAVAANVETPPLANTDIDIDALPKPEKAFEVFCGRRFLAAGYSSGNVHKPLDDIPAASGFDAAALESPYERYNRLRSEIKQLADELSVVDSEVDQESKEDGAGIVHSAAYDELARSVKGLQESLVDLGQSKALSSTTSVREGSRGALERKLKAHIVEGESSKEGNETKEGRDSPPGRGGIKYELFYSRAQAEALEMAEAKALEQRIAELERCIGAEQLSQSTKLSIGDRLLHMEARVKCLDADALEAAGRKAKTLNSDLDALQRLQRKTGKFPVTNGASFSSDEVAAMFKKLERCDAISAAVDPLLERLEVLAQVHAGNARHQNRLSALEEGQEHLRQLLGKDLELLQEMKKSMKENMGIIQQNVESLQS